MNDLTQPALTRPATEADWLLAGELSCIWPMTNRHPADAIHLAIYVNDRVAVPVLPEAPK